MRARAGCHASRVEGDGASAGATGDRRLDARGTEAIERALHLRYTTQVEQVIHRRHLLRNFLIGRGESRTIHSELKRRVRDGRTPLDYAQSLLTLRERIGLDKVTYLVTVQLIAISGVPGMMAACCWRCRCIHTGASASRRIRAALGCGDPCAADGQDSLHDALPEGSDAAVFHPFNNRRVAACDLQVEGQAIAEGTVFELSSFIQHRSAKYWDDPLLFDPDRWLPERRKRTAGIYVPYGFPTRSCVGSAVGNAQLVLLCALLAREFRFTPAPTTGPRCAWKASRFPRRCTARSRAMRPVPDLQGRAAYFAVRPCSCMSSCRIRRSSTMAGVASCTL